MNARGQQNAQRTQHQYNARLGQSAHIDVAYETRQPAQKQQQLPMHMNTQRAHTLSHQRTSSITSSSTSNFVKKQWSRFNRSTASHARGQADDNEIDNEKGVDFTADANAVDVSFDDLQHIRGDRFGGMSGSGTTPYIPTIITRGDLSNSHNISNEQYRKLQMASKKQRALHLASNQPDVNARSQSFQTGGPYYQHPAQQPLQQPQMPPMGAYPPNGPRSMSLQSRGGFGPPRAMSLQQRGAPVQPPPGSGYYRNGPPPHGFDPRIKPPVQHQQQQHRPNGPPPQQLLQPRPQLSVQSYPQQPQAPQQPSMPPPHTQQQYSNFNPQYARQQIQSKTADTNEPYNRYAHNGQAPFSNHSEDLISPPNSAPSSALIAPKKKVQKINFNMDDEEDTSSSPEPRLPEIATPTMQANEPKEASAVIGDHNVNPRQSTISVLSDTQHGSNSNKIYSQANDTNTTGNTVFYSALDFDNTNGSTNNNSVNTLNKQVEEEENNENEGDFVLKFNKHQKAASIVEDESYDKTIQETPKFNDGSSSIDYNTTPVIPSNPIRSLPTPMKPTVDQSLRDLPTPKFIQGDDDEANFDFNRYSVETPLNIATTSTGATHTMHHITSQIKSDVLTSPSNSNSESLLAPVTPNSQRSTITFTAEQYGKVNDNEMLLKELELVTHELADAVSHELVLEDTIIKAVSPIKSSSASPKSSSSINRSVVHEEIKNPEEFLKSKGIFINKDGDDSKVPQAISVSQRGQIILQLVKLVAEERKKRYTIEEMLLAYQNENGIPKDQDDLIQKLKVENLTLKNENSRLNNEVELNETKKELLQIESENLKLELDHTSRKLMRLQKDVVPMLEKQINTLEELILKRVEE